MNRYVVALFNMFENDLTIRFVTASSKAEVFRKEYSAFFDDDIPDFSTDDEVIEHIYNAFVNCDNVIEVAKVPD